MDDSQKNVGHFPIKNEISEIYYHEYFLLKENIIYNFKITNIDKSIIIRCKNYSITLTLNDIALLTNIEFNSINKSYEYIVDLFEDNKVIIKSILPTKKLKLNFKINNEKEFEMALIYNKENNDFIISEINKLKSDVNYLKIENDKLQKKIQLLKKFHAKDMKCLFDVTKDSCAQMGYNNTFTVFKSLNNILCIIYSNENNSIISYDLDKKKLITEIKNSHNKIITNFRYYFDNLNKRDLILSLSHEDNNLKLWNAINWNCLLNITNVNKSGYLLSSCFLNIKNDNYLVTSNCNYYGNSEPVKIYDFNGNKIKEINSSDMDTFFVDTYYDKRFKKLYIISSNVNCTKSYDYNKNELYHNYSDNNSSDHNSFIIVNDEDKIKLIDLCSDGNIRIWNFHSGVLLNRIKVSDGRLLCVCLWDNNHLYVSSSDKKIKLVNLQNGLIINSLSGHNNSVLSIKKIIHPKYGKCLISQGWRNDQIKLWINKD